MDQGNTRRLRILQNAPAEVLSEFLKKHPQHSKSVLAKGPEAVLDEIFRLYDADTVRVLYEEFPGPQNFGTWFYRPKAKVTQKEIRSAIHSKVTPKLSEGTKPKPTETPVIYRIDSSDSTLVLRYVAADRTQRLALDFDEVSTVHTLSFYDCVYHFSEVVGLVFGPYKGSKADEVMADADQFLGLGAQWELLKPQRGESREFYNAVKERLVGFLIETKRHDPGGDYKTITLEARQKQPDLEKVADFRKRYLNADSYYDVIQFKCKNKLGLLEETHVKFGYPFGRFAFKHGTSLSAILYFQAKISALLR